MKKLLLISTLALSTSLNCLTISITEGPAPKEEQVAKPEKPLTNKEKSVKALGHIFEKTAAWSLTFLVVGYFVSNSPVETRLKWGAICGALSGVCHAGAELRK